MENSNCSAYTDLYFEEVPTFTSPSTTSKYQPLYNLEILNSQFFLLLTYFTDEWLVYSLWFIYHLLPIMPISFSLSPRIIPNHFFMAGVLSVNIIGCSFHKTGLVGVGVLWQNYSGMSKAVRITMPYWKSFAIWDDLHFGKLRAKSVTILANKWLVGELNLMCLFMWVSIWGKRTNSHQTTHG